MKIYSFRNEVIFQFTIELKNNRLPCFDILVAKAVTSQKAKQSSPFFSQRTGNKRREQKNYCSQTTPISYNNIIQHTKIGTILKIFIYSFSILFFFELF